MKKICISILTGMLILGGFPWSAPVAKAANAITVPDDLIINQGEVTLISGIEVTGDPGTVPVKLLATGGTLSFGSTTGLTFTGASTGDELYFSGDVDDINAALDTLQFTNATAETIDLEVSLVEEGEVFLEENGHLYEYISVPGGITWQNALTAAAGQERYGSTGYLATITSENENDFVSARLGGAGWMGASDAAVEGEWRWVTGPEAGDQFWQGDGSGAAVGGAYENWNTGEPNDSSGEDCAQFLAGGSGEWNDLPCTGTTLTGYVVEFGSPGDLPQTAGETFSITSVARPTLDSFTPADGALEIERDTELTLTFNEAIDPNEGFIHIYKVEGDSLEESIDVEGDQVLGGVVGTIIVQPERLAGSEEYYILIDAGTFINAAGGTYAGLDDETAWNFTTVAGGSRLEKLARIEEQERRMEEEVQEEPQDGSSEQEEQGPVAQEDEEGHEEVVDEPQEERAEGVKEEKVQQSDVADGTLIKLAERDTVYLVDGGKRRPFPHFNIFFTWFEDFDDVEVISQEEMASIPMGAPVLPKEGTLVKLASMPEVYVIEGGGAPALRHIKDEEEAVEEFGEKWVEQVMDIEITLFQYFNR